MQFNLKTFMTAYQKLSPDVLVDYVTKEELDSKNYVTEAPDDGAIYGRDGKNKLWVELENSAVRSILIRYGASQYDSMEMGGLPSSRITKLEKATKIMRDGRTSYTQILDRIVLNEDSWVWVCSSQKLLEGGLGVELAPAGVIITEDPDKKYAIRCDYIEPEKTILGDDKVPYYCYRIRKKLAEGTDWTFIVDFNIEENKE